MVKVLAVDDEEPFRRLLSKELPRRGFHLDTASDGKEALAALGKESYDVVLLDLVMPGMDGLSLLGALKGDPSAPAIVVITGNASIKTAVEAMRAGAFDYLTKPYKLDELKIIIDRAYEFRRLSRKSEAMDQKTLRLEPEAEIIGGSKSLHRLMALVRKVAPTDSSVLVTGESGTGKELVASAIRRMSLRAEAPYMAINCSTFSANLIESELFGHERGAFTDAYKTKFGIVEAADKGTLFLDEVAELPMELQVKLLRFLDSGEFRRVGGSKTMKADVRLIAATNRDLKKLMEKGVFREDLYYRLNVIHIEVPALRDRMEDVAELSRHFAQVASRRLSRPELGISKDAIEALSAYRWPGNVRELENVIERAAVLAESDMIEPRDLSLPKESVAGAALGAGNEQYPQLEEIEKSYIMRVLKETGGNQSMASRILGINRKTLYLKMKRYGLTE